MSGFENYAEEARDLERELVRKGLALGIDWNDAAQVAVIAREAIAYKPQTHGLPHDPQQRARIELFALSQLMLKVMTESAESGLHTHGGPTWKALARALYDTMGLIKEDV